MVHFDVRCFVYRRLSNWHGNCESFLPHLVPFRTCPSSQRRRSNRSCGSFEVSYSKTIPLTFILRFVSLKTLRIPFEISSTVSLTASTEVLLGSGTFKENRTLRETCDSFLCSSKSLFRSIPVWSPHSTCTRPISHSSTEPQPIRGPKKFT